MKLRRNLVIAAMSIATMGAGFAGVAVASGGGGTPSPSHSHTSTQDDDENEGQEGKEAKEPESPGDQARQDAACTAAGIPLTGTNIDYDDETGVCQLDSGDDEGGEDGEDGGTE